MTKGEINGQLMSLGHRTSKLLPIVCKVNWKLGIMAYRAFALVRKSPIHRNGGSLAENVWMRPTGRDLKVEPTPCVSFPCTTNLRILH